MRVTVNNNNKHPDNIMAKALTKSQIVAELATKNSLSKKQAVEILESLVQLAYKHAKDSFTIPGLGKLVLVTAATQQATAAEGQKGKAETSANEAAKTLTAIQTTKATVDSDATTIAVAKKTAQESATTSKSLAEAAKAVATAANAVRT